MKALKELKTQVDFVEALFTNFMLSMNEHMENRKAYPDGGWCSKNYMNKNCGKIALKRKITLIRQELLNLERILDDGGVF